MDTDEHREPSKPSLLARLLFRHPERMEASTRRTTTRVVVWLLVIVGGVVLLSLLGRDPQRTAATAAREAFVKDCVEQMTDPRIAGPAVYPRTWEGISRATDHCYGLAKAAADLGTLRKTTR